MIKLVRFVGDSSDWRLTKERWRKVKAVARDNLLLVGIDTRGRKSFRLLLGTLLLVNSMLHEVLSDDLGLRGVSLRAAGDLRLNHGV